MCGCNCLVNQSPSLPACWTEREGSYSGLWTRQGNTGRYDAKWTRGGEVVTDVVEFEWVHDGVICFHRLANNGRYVGFLTNDAGKLIITRGAMDWSQETWTAEGRDNP
ncbi:MAG: hypothetical protein AB7T27_02420 [Kiritimatiellia bacterium]